jgi:hypothetical protein
MAVLILVGFVIAVNARFYGFFYRVRGFWFTLGVVPLHMVYYLYSVTGFAVGTLQHRLASASKRAR